MLPDGCFVMFPIVGWFWLLLIKALLLPYYHQRKARGVSGGSSATPTFDAPTYMWAAMGDE